MLPCVSLLDAKQHKNKKKQKQKETTNNTTTETAGTHTVGTLRRRQRRRRKREEGGDEGGEEEEAAAINGDTMETYGNILDIHQIYPNITKYSLYLFVHVTKALQEPETFWELAVALTCRRFIRIFFKWPCRLDPHQHRRGDPDGTAAGRHPSRGLEMPQPQAAGCSRVNL